MADKCMLCNCYMPDAEFTAEMIWIQNEPLVVCECCKEKSLFHVEEQITIQ